MCVNDGVSTRKLYPSPYTSDVVFRGRMETPLSNESTRFRVLTVI